MTRVILLSTTIEEYERFRRNFPDISEKLWNFIEISSLDDRTRMECLVLLIILHEWSGDADDIQLEKMSYLSHVIPTWHHSPKRQDMRQCLNGQNNGYFIPAKKSEKFPRRMLDGVIAESFSEISRRKSAEFYFRENAVPIFREEYGWRWRVQRFTEKARSKQRSRDRDAKSRCMDDSIVDGSRWQGHLASKFEEPSIWHKREREDPRSSRHRKIGRKYWNRFVRLSQPKWSKFLSNFGEWVDF
eukprot:TRINITY_DN5412_c0_g1_i1.p2 TRINITY_DN5412_c0_g1~~TRINITY_DN5412_c0_g1_i1.p2  ORF type:complete len:244 (+),score=58.34 TRINITY_DN5412_c0_g1_i1:946-1677(+)